MAKRGSRNTMNNKRRAAATAAIFLFLILLCIGAIGGGRAEAATVSIVIGSAKARASGSVDIAIDAQQAPKIGSMQFVLLYDPSVLKAEKVTRGRLAGDNSMLESNVETPGRVKVAMVSMDGMTGDGTIATVRFQAIGKPGQSSTLSFESIKAWERSTQYDVLISSQEGRVTVGANWLLWVIIAAVLLFLLVLLLVVVIKLARRSPAPPLQAGPVNNNYYQPPQPPQQQGYAFCPHCGGPLQPGVAFCTSCGNRLG